MGNFSRERNYVGNEQIVVNTDEGNFVISYEENEKIYIGFNGSVDQTEDVVFKITEEYGKLYKNLFDLVTVRDEKGYIVADTRIICISDDLFYVNDKLKDDKNSASYVSICRDGNVIYLTFHKSSSKYCCNSYFVAISPENSAHGKKILELYNSLTDQNIDVKHAQSGSSRVKVANR